MRGHRPTTEEATNTLVQLGVSFEQARAILAGEEPLPGALASAATEEELRAIAEAVRDLRDPVEGLRAALRDTFSTRDFWLLFIGAMVGMAIMILGHLIDGVIS